MTNRIIRTSDDLPKNHWMAAQLPAGTSLRGYAEDRAVSLLTRAVINAIEKAGLSRTDIANALGTTKSWVSQVLNGSTNMTLKTLGALFWAAGRQVTELRDDVLGAEKSKAIPLLLYDMETATSPNKRFVAAYEMGFRVEITQRASPAQSHWQ